jgi:hypothetical protein
MNKRHLVIVGLLTCLWFETSIADTVILSSEFSGNEPEMQNQFPGENVPLPYLTIGPVTVSSNGDYSFQDGRFAFLTDITVSVHTGVFDPSNPLATQQALVDDLGEVTLAVNTQLYPRGTTVLFGRGISCRRGIRS